MSNQTQRAAPRILPNRELIRRLLKLSWVFRVRCLQVLFFQISVVIFGLFALGLTGLGIDYLRYVLLDGDTPKWPFGISPADGVSPYHVMAVISCTVVAVALFRGFLNYFNMLSINRLVHVDIVVRLRAQVYEKLQKLSFRFFDTHESGTIINRVTGDVQAVRLFIDQVVLRIFILILTLTVYLFYMFNIHVGLTLACLATTPLLWVITASFSKIVRPLYIRNRELMDRLILTFSECIQGINTIKGFNLEQHTVKRFRTENRDIRDQQERIFWLVSLFGPSVGMLTQVNLMVLLGYGGWLAIQGEVAVGTGLIVFAGILQQFSTQISDIAGIANNIQQSLTGAQRVFEILDAPVEVDSPPNPIRLTKVNGEIRFEHVHFHYEINDTVLHDISFTTKPGEVIAVAGATGSGKTALMSLIPRFYDPTKGRILLDGHDLREFAVEDLRRQIGLVFQENFLFSNTIAANIAFGHPHATRAQIEKAARIACAEEFIHEFPDGYDTILRESGSNLSGGQRQRLAIARAILLEPAVLLLDDPTAAIDPETENEILEAIERAIKGRTTFIVAHRLSTLKRADRVMVLEEGCITQVGTHSDLMKKPGLYQRAVNLQAVDPESMRLLELGRLNRRAPQ